MSKINLIYEPTVYFVGSSAFHNVKFSEFMQANDISTFEVTEDPFDDNYTPPLDLIPEVAGRLCYMSYDSGMKRKTNKEYLAHIKEVGHESVLEHSTFTFIIEGVSRSLTHELVRHRVGASYSQLSQRYVDPGQGIEVVVPPEYIGNTELVEEFACCMGGMLDTYLKLREKADSELEIDDTKTNKKKRTLQAARCVLPNATATKIMVTMNGRSLRHFFHLRGSEFADSEIRRLAIAMYDTVKRLNILDDFEIVQAEGNPVPYLIK